MCSFEFIYFARPDSEMQGRSLYEARRQMGRELAREAPVDADVVITLPDSGTPAAIGFAEETGIHFEEGMIKSRYITRTFIQPSQRLRDSGIRLKFNPMRHVLEGQRVALVDDSIVRGTTSRRIVDELRRAGAAEVHMRIASPPIMWPCFMGIDIASRNELIAAGKQRGRGGPPGRRRHPPLPEHRRAAPLHGRPRGPRLLLRLLHRRLPGRGAAPAGDGQAGDGAVAAPPPTRPAPSRNSPEGLPAGGR